MNASAVNAALLQAGINAIYATDGKRAVRFWKKYHPNMDAAYQISRSEAARYLPSLAQ